MVSPDISVVIPVFNAERFVSGAVASALRQPEVREILLVEDGSLDESARVCRELADRHPTVRLLQHPDRRNHGASGSRNLGIRSASSSHLAFLDADDYYLDGRFSTAEEIMRRRPECDGVYEAVGTSFESDDHRRRLEAEGIEPPELSTVGYPFEGFELFLAFAAHRTNHFLLNGLTVKTSVFDRVGLFDVNLKLSQDSEMAFRLAENAIWSRAGWILPLPFDEFIAAIDTGCLGARKSGWRRSDRMRPHPSPGHARTYRGATTALFGTICS